MRALWTGLILTFCLSCSVLEKRTTPLAFIDPEKAEIEAMEGLLQREKYQEVVDAADLFQVKNGYSLKIQKARFLKANALEEMERWSEAADTYRIISLFSERNQPEISALSIYRLSFVYEALGDDQRVLTTLLEALQYKTYLPMEVSLAEIPSRIAMVYAKENNAKEADRWLAEAEKGLQKTLENRRSPLTENWLAKTYYNMGSISTNQLSSENILTVIQGQQVIQKYLIRALQYGDPVWSVKALKRLRTTYGDLWASIDKFPEPAGIEPMIANKMKKDEQFRLAGPYAELIKDAQLYRPTNEQVTNIQQMNFFSFLDEMQDRVKELLQNPVVTPLTSDSRKAIPRNDVPIQGPDQEIPSQDPNL